MRLRLATADDAPAFIAHQHAIVAEPERTAPLEPDEIRDLDAMRAWVVQPLTLVAVDDAPGDAPGGAPGDALLGTLTLRRPSPRRSFRHVAELGMSVRQAARGQGVGQALLRDAIARAPADGIERIELRVFATNARAIALYEKLGFEHEGRRRRAVHIDGRYFDSLIMARLL